MTTFIFAVISLILVFTTLNLWARMRNGARADFIRSYMFPPGLLDRFSIHHPNLALKDRQLVAHALRQFFIAYLKSGHKFVSMPSQVADDLWHEFNSIPVTMIPSVSRRLAALCITHRQ